MDYRKITFVHIGMARDGAERVIAHLANTYAEKGFFVDIIVLLHNRCEYDLHPNVKVVSFVRSDVSRRKNLLYWVKSIRKYMKKEKPEKVISFSMYVNIITLLACVGLHKEILISERNDPTSDGRSKFDVFLTNVLYKYADKIVFQTKRAMNSFPESIRKRSKIIGNPVFVACQASSTKQDKIVTVGRLAPQKNQKLLLNAFAKVVASYPQIRLEVYGKGELLDSLQEQCRQLGISNSVNFKGNVTNVHECISDARAFVLSSDFEGLSNALLEAMAMGLPCISTDCAGSDEIIESGVNGMLVHVGDTEGLSNAIMRVLADEELASKISRNAKNIGNLYNHEAVIRQWLDYIDVK